MAKTRYKRKMKVRTFWTMKSARRYVKRFRERIIKTENPKVISCWIKASQIVRHKISLDKRTI